MSIRDKFIKKPKEYTEYTLDEALQRIMEKPEFAADCGYDVSKLHCHGCIKTCVLDAPKCDFGVKVTTSLRKIKNA